MGRGSPFPLFCGSVSVSAGVSLGGEVFRRRVAVRLRCASARRGGGKPAIVRLSRGFARRPAPARAVRSVSPPRQGYSATRRPGPSDPTLGYPDFVARWSVCPRGLTIFGGPGGFSNGLWGRIPRSAT